MLRPMTEHANLDPRWIGVSELARLRSYTSLENWVLTVVNVTWKAESFFMRDHTGFQVMEALRSASSDRQTSSIIPDVRLDEFVDEVFAGHFRVRGHHDRFIDVLKQLLETGHGNLETLADAFLQHVTNLANAYANFGEEICRAGLLIVGESETNANFRTFLEACIGRYTHLISQLNYSQTVETSY